MAATVGADLNAGGFTRTLPPRHTNFGPYISSGGNVYGVVRGSGASGTVHPLQATDPMSAFTAIASAKLMSSASTTAIEAMACYQVGNVIHIATQISTGACYYNTYDMSTDTWGFTTSEVVIAAASQAPVSGMTFVDLVVRSTGSVVFVYNAGQTAMSSTFNMVRYRIRQTNGVYGTATNVDNGGSVDWTGGVCALGASDRVHFLLKSGTAQDLFQRTLTAANVLQTFPAAFEAADVANVPHVFPGAISYVDAGTTRIRSIYMSQAATGTALTASLVKFDSSDTPTVSQDVDFADPAIGTSLANNQFIGSLSNDGTTLHALYSGNSLGTGPGDLAYDSSVSGGGAWGTDTNELAGTINHITSNVYTRSGTTYLAMVLDNAGTIQYAEITLAAAVTASLIWPTETPYRILSRR